jgi:two-component system sensor histidine kinase PilS (NtrC family)
MTRAQPILPLESRETFWRTMLTFNVTRMVIALVLLVFLSFNTKKDAGTNTQFGSLETCIVYLILAAIFAIFAAYRRRRFLLQLIPQIAIDIAVISMLYFAAGGVKSGLPILYLFPLAGVAILAPLLVALFFASAVTIFLLAESIYQAVTQAIDASFSQSGLYGAAFFATVIVINRLAAKLIKQEDLAAQRGRDLRVQEAINRLVIADMGDGILVVAADGTVLTGNPAAERMLGLTIPYDKPAILLTDMTALAPIADAFFSWSGKSDDRTDSKDDTSIFVVVKPGDEMALQGTTTIWGWRRELTARLKLRFATVETAGLAEERTVIFLQDVTEIENQAQQLKLASMGRLTASIAHEVRNPLSAISHAASLLSEDAPSTSGARLLNIIADNVARLNQMIEDILQLSRKAQSHGEPLALTPFFTEILAELQETHALQKEMVYLAEMDQYFVRFDPLHLREVIMNLLSNALRYASGRRGSIKLHVVSDVANRLELHVQDDGPAITPEVRAHLFEPFYTTSSKGTGLGLYVARELCLNNGSMLDYEYRMESCADGRDEARGRFVITFALPDQL